MTRRTRHSGPHGHRWALLITAITLAAATLVAAAQQEESRQSVPPEEYVIYDRVIQEKFLTSLTELVTIERMTVTKLGPEDFSPTRAFFDEKQFFDGTLPPDVVTDFIVKSGKSWRLESRFTFEVRYRFVSGGIMEEPEVSLSPMPAAGRPFRKFSRFDPTRIGVLRFSRVGFNRRENQALVYVGDHRPDGSGAGFLIFLRRAGQNWEILDTEVLWTAQETE